MLSQAKLKFIVGLGVGIFVALFILTMPVFAGEQSGLSKKLEAVELKIPFGDLPKVFSEAKVEPCVAAGYDCKGNANCELQKKNYCAQIPWIAIYIGAVYRYAVIIGSVIAVLVIMIGGIMYLLAGFDQKLITTGQDMMKNATFGLILLLSSYLILNAINPNLVKLKPIGVEIAEQETIEFAGKEVKKLEGTKGFMENCEDDDECWSGSCEEIGSSKKCVCDDDGDCQPGEKCNTSTNICEIKKKIGDPCADDEQCITEECSDSGKCVCDEDIHCEKNATCVSMPNDENYCSMKKGVGMGCSSDNECYSGNCDQIGANKYCVCDDNDDCPAGYFCDENSNKTQCKKFGAVGDLCVTNDDCSSEDCEEDHWYGVWKQEKRCECNNNKDCPQGSVCVDVENDCGWNYCSVGKIESVPENYNSMADPAAINKSKGLCDADDQCQSDDCDIDWGINDCNACSK